MSRATLGGGGVSLLHIAPVELQGVSHVDAAGDPALVTLAVDALRSPVIALELPCEGSLWVVTAGE